MNIKHSTRSAAKLTDATVAPDISSIIWLLDLVFFVSELDTASLPPLNVVRLVPCCLSNEAANRGAAIVVRCNVLKLLTEVDFQGIEIGPVVKNKKCNCNYIY